METYLSMIPENHIILPISEYLKSFWQHWTFYPKQTNSFLYGIYIYEHKIDAEKLRKSIQNLIDNNYNLRSNFLEENNRILWFIKPEALAK